MLGWLDANLVSILNGFAIGSLLFILALGLSVVFGMMDVLNLAHGALYLIGSYLAVSFAAGGAVRRRVGRTCRGP
jgi:branched-chain amino acid transport system permease protein